MSEWHEQLFGTLLGRIRIWDFWFIFFKPVFEHRTGGEAMSTNETGRKCWLIIHPSRAPSCCSRHSDLRGLRLVMRPAVFLVEITHNADTAVSPFDEALKAEITSSKRPFGSPSALRWPHPIHALTPPRRHVQCRGRSVAQSVHEHVSFEPLESPAPPCPLLSK